MSDNSSFLQFDQCTNFYISTYSIRAILLLPLSISVLVHGLQKWRKHRSVKNESHFDVLTCQLAAMEFIWVILLPFHIIDKLYNRSVETSVIRSLVYMTMYGEIIFHTLTCAERYIAIVHPIIYMKMKTSPGTRIRNVSIGFAWLVCLVLVSLKFVDSLDIPLFCLLAFSLIVTSFCTISVLHVLACPDYREGGVQKKKADRAKHRAFYTITTISSMHWIWFIGLLVYKLLTNFNLLSFMDACLVGHGVFLFNLPSCLVMPLLYLHKAGKLPHKC